MRYSSTSVQKIKRRQSNTMWQMLPAACGLVLPFIVTCGFESEKGQKCKKKKH